MNQDSIMENFSVALKRLRKAKKLSQEEVVKRIGPENLSLRSYKQYESGDSGHLPTIDKIVILAEFFDVNLDYLLLGWTCVFDASYTWTSQLKRLGRLVHSLVLLPCRDEDGHYCFKTYDPEVDIFMDRFVADCGYSNLLVAKGVPYFVTPKQIDAEINGLGDQTKSTALSKERFIEFCKNSGREIPTELLASGEQKK